MKRSFKTKTKRDAKRDLFVELGEGMKALAEERLGKRTLRTHPKNKTGGGKMFVTLRSRDSMKIGVKECQSVQTKTAL